MPDLYSALETAAARIVELEKVCDVHQQIIEGLHRENRKDRAELDAARARLAELEAEFVPDRWWRVIYDAPGGVWCESSNEDEVRRSLDTCPSPGVLQRTYRREQFQWRDA